MHILIVISALILAVLVYAHIWRPWRIEHRRQAQIIRTHQMLYAQPPGPRRPSAWSRFPVQLKALLYFACVIGVAVLANVR